jgi:hypothetical protein
MGDLCFLPPFSRLSDLELERFGDISGSNRVNSNLRNGSGASVTAITDQIDFARVGRDSDRLRHRSLSG